MARYLREAPETTRQLRSQSAGDAIAEYAWDLDADGQYDDATCATPTFNTTEDGDHVVAVRVTDARGGSSTATATVTMATVAPTVNAGGPYAGHVDEVITLSSAGSFDPGADIVSYAWNLDADGQYDDATGLTAPFSASATGVYAVSVQVTDENGAISTASASVEVTEAPDETPLFIDDTRFESKCWGHALAGCRRGAQRGG